MKTKTIELAGTKVTLSKLSIKKLAETVNSLTNLPPELKTTLVTLDKIEVDEALAQLPMIIATALPYLSTTVIKACDSKDITEDFLQEECGLDDVVYLVEEWLELNNIKGIIDRVKKMQALFPKAKPVLPPQIDAPKT